MKVQIERVFLNDRDVDPVGCYGRIRILFSKKFRIRIQSRHQDLKSSKIELFSFNTCDISILLTFMSKEEFYWGNNII